MQSFLLAAVDTEDSKHSFNGEEQLASGPHHHGVIQIHPYTISFWNEIALWKQMAREINGIETIDVRPISTLADLNEWSSYSMKFSYRLADSRKYSEYLDVILPKHKSGVFENTNLVKKCFVQRIFWSIRFKQHEYYPLIY